jgi:acetyl-CoA acetyltransferase
VQRALGIDPAKLNVNGGSIAIGHPFGMTGSRQVKTTHRKQTHARSATELVVAQSQWSIGHIDVSFFFLRRHTRDCIFYMRRVASL